MTNELQNIMRMRDDISGIFDNFIDNRYPENAVQEDESGAWIPEVDVRETKDEFVLFAALPGVKKEEVQTEIKENILTISGSRSVKNDEKDGWLRREMASGRFYRAFKIGPRVKTDAIKASFRDGVLEIKIPKADEEKASKIAIE